MLKLLFAVALLCQSVFSMPIDDYVWRPDSAYGWVEMPEHNIYGHQLGWTGYMLNMTSQRWRTDADYANNSDCKSLWWHYLVVIVPDEIKYTNNGSLWITGGSNTNSPPTISSEDILVAAALALTTGTVCGALFQVPNEHMIFAADPIQKSRSEDAIIAYTWDEFLRDPSQPEKLVRFPMVKASLRAMDAMSEFMIQKLPQTNIHLDYFGVSGASKRGWTTWLVGAVDPKRVMVIVPIVLDAINFQKVEHHQFMSYNGWANSLHDYTDMNIMSRLDDPNMHLLSLQEDPYFFKERLTMPKLVVNAVMDEFQQPDDITFWWNDMPEPKHFIIAPNAEHSEATGILEIVPAISAWMQTHLAKSVVPTFTWEINNSTGEIVATLDEHGLVHEANVWYAYSCGFNKDGAMRRDFRISSLDNPCQCGMLADGNCVNLKSWWHKEALVGSTVRGRRTYSAKLDAPGDGRWVAFMIDIKYAKNSKEGDSKLSLFPHDLVGRLEFTTAVSIWPAVYPFADCTGAACGNTLL